MTKPVKNPLQIDIIRSKMRTIQILLLAERDRCAKTASEITTGELVDDKNKWEHESLLTEMFMYDMMSDIVEAMMKSLV